MGRIRFGPKYEPLILFFPKCHWAESSRLATKSDLWPNHQDLGLIAINIIFSKMPLGPIFGPKYESLILFFQKCPVPQNKKFIFSSILNHVLIFDMI